MAYTKEQLRQIIYLNIIDNVSEEIDPEDLRLTLNAIADSIFEQVAGSASGFYFGPWIAQPYKVGWIAISTDGTKLWRALQAFNSAVEPSVNSAYWKLIAEFPAAATVNQLQTDLTALQQELVALKKTVDGLQVPDAPEGAEWEVEPRITVEGSTIKAMNVARALWNGLPMDYPVGDLTVAVKPVYPLKRVDLVAVFEDGTYTIEKGVESEGSPVQPGLPAGALYATFVLWTSSGGSTDTSGYDALNVRLTAVEGKVANIENKYVRFENGKLYDPNGQVVQVGSDFYFGPWKAQTFKIGWVAISADKRRMWQALREAASAAEPVAESLDWKLIFESAGAEYADSISYQGSLEALHRYEFAAEFTAIDTGTRLLSPEISVEGSAYSPLIVGTKIAAGKWFKIRITYAGPQTEGVLIIKVKKQ